MSNRGFANRKRCRKFSFCGTSLFLTEHLSSLFLTTKFPPLIIITTKNSPTNFQNVAQEQDNLYRQL